MIPSILPLSEKVPTFKKGLPKGSAQFAALILVLLGAVDLL